STLYEQRKESRTLSAEFTLAATGFAADHEVTVGVLIQAAWAILLSRYMGTDDVVFGVTRSGRRSFPRAEEIVKPLINTIPFRVRVEHSLPVSGFIHKIRSLMLELRPYESVPLDLLLERAGKSPFNALYVYDNITPQESFRNLGGPWSQRTITRFQRTDSELTLAAYGAPSMTLDLIYDTALFTATTAAAMTRHLEA